MNLAYSYFLLSSVFNAVVFTFLSVFVLFKDRKNKINKLLSLVCLALAAWAWAYMGWPLSNTSAGTLFWFQILHIGACFIPIFYLHFIVTWLDLNNRKNKIIIKFGYIFSIFFACSTFSPLFIKDMVPKFSMRFWAEPGILYHFYLMVFFGLLLYSFYILLRNLFQSTGVRRQQIKFILIGIVLTLIGGSTNYFLFYNINIPPYGNILASSFVILTVYAIIRYNLLDIKVIATESFVLVLNFVLVFQFLFSGTLIRFLINGLILISVFIISFLFIRSAHQEVHRREEVTLLARNLEDSNVCLKELDRQRNELLSLTSEQLKVNQKLVNISQQKRIKEIIKGNDRLINLVESFCNISDFEKNNVKLNITPVIINEFVAETVAEVKNLSKEKRLAIELEKSNMAGEVDMDRKQIRYVLEKLLDNALRYNPSDSAIKVSVRAYDEGVSVCVKDNGIGFGRGEWDDLYGKFFRSRQATIIHPQGTGLSLHLCRKIIEAHGGRVLAHSLGLRKGAEFGFWLPNKFNLL